MLSITATTASTGFNCVSDATKFAVRAMCPAPRAGLAKAAARLRGKGMSWVSDEDLEQDSWLLKLENPSFDASKLVACSFKKNLQAFQKSVICGVSIDEEFGGEEGTGAIQIAAPDVGEIERWRYAEPGIDVENLRGELCKFGKIGDRQARNLINAAAKKIADESQPGLFGWTGGAA